MTRLSLILVGLCVLLGISTQVLGAEQKQAPWITREGAVAMLVESKPAWRAELAAIRANPEPMPLYSDTDQGEWYIPYLEVAFTHGLISATDFHREFRPGELLKQGEAMALLVRYAANGDASKLPHEEPDHPLSIPLHVQAGYDMGLKPPTPFESWNVIRRSAWYDLAKSAGVPNPAAIVVTIPVVIPTVVPQLLPVTGPSLPAPTPDLQPIFPVQQQNPATGYKPASSAPVQPTYTQPIQSQPTYSQNLTESQPISSDDIGSFPSPADPNDSYFAIGIPSLGINDLKITHPTNVATQQGLLAPLQNGVGHLFSYPGNGGTILVYGHSSGYSWDVSEYTKIFRQINKLKSGDKVYIAYGGKTFTYEVTFSQTVDATDMSAYQKNNGEELILYTCWPPDDVKQRYLVHAKPVS